jgi:hypothetical protein
VTNIGELKEDSQESEPPQEARRSMERYEATTTAEPVRDDRSMTILEIVLAVAALATVFLLAGLR